MKSPASIPTTNWQVSVTSPCKHSMYASKCNPAYITVSCLQKYFTVETNCLLAFYNANHVCCLRVNVMKINVYLINKNKSSTLFKHGWISCSMLNYGYCAIANDKSATIIQIMWQTLIQKWGRFLWCGVQWVLQGIAQSLMTNQQLLFRSRDKIWPTLFLYVSWVYPYSKCHTKWDIANFGQMTLTQRSKVKVRSWSDSAHPLSYMSHGYS